jgi:hypothetical protein
MRRQRFFIPASVKLSGGSRDGSDAKKPQPGSRLDLMHYYDTDADGELALPAFHLCHRGGNLARLRYTESPVPFSDDLGEVERTNLTARLFECIDALAVLGMVSSTPAGRKVKAGALIVFAERTGDAHKGLALSLAGDVLGGSR